MTKRAKIVFKKGKQQEIYEKNTFINFLKTRITNSSTGLARGIKLPKYITFTIKDSSILCIYIQEQIDDKGKIHNPICENMQTDNAAFEGWAIVLKAWMPNAINKVRLSWDTPKGDNAKSTHYYRFLYRCINFKHDYSWFEVNSNNKDELIAFHKRFQSARLTISTSSKEPDKKLNNENSVEYEFVDRDNTKVRNKIMTKYDLDILNHQLPVGVKDGKDQFFPGGQAAIDIWGVNTTSHTLYMYELKYIDSLKKNKNIKVGIISELYFYAKLVRDIILGIISPKSINLIKTKDQKWFYGHCHGLKSIHAIMLSNEFHPLICNDKVLSILNESTAISNVPITFSKVIYRYKVGTYDLAFI